MLIHGELASSLVPGTMQLTQHATPFKPGNTHRARNAACDSVAHTAWGALPAALLRRCAAASSVCCCAYRVLACMMHAEQEREAVNRWGGGGWGSSTGAGRRRLGWRIRASWYSLPRETRDGHMVPLPCGRSCWNVPCMPHTIALEEHHTGHGSVRALVANRAACHCLEHVAV